MKKEEKALVLKAIEFLNEATTYNTTQSATAAKDELMKLLYVSARNISSNIDIFKFCCKGNLRPIMTGVCYDIENEVAVASNGRVLLVSKPDYVNYTHSSLDRTVWGNDSHPCYVVTKSGAAFPKENYYCYPDYQSVLKAYATDEVEVAIDSAALRDCIKLEKTRRKADRYSPEKVIKIGDHYFSLEVAELMSKFSDGVFYTSKKNYSAFYFKSNNGDYQAVFMPSLEPDVPYNKTLDDYVINLAA